jgi:hypothetical protein
VSADTVEADTVEFVFVILRDPYRQESLAAMPMTSARGQQSFKDGPKDSETGLVLNLVLFWNDQKGFSKTSGIGGVFTQILQVVRPDSRKWPSVHQKDPSADRETVVIIYIVREIPAAER